MNFERKIDSIFSQISYFQQEIKAEHACFQHCTKNEVLHLGFLHIYRRNPSWKTSFSVQFKC